MSVENLSAVKLALAGRSLWQQDGALRVAEPIAVVGMALRFPNGIDTPDKLWDMLLAGGDAIREVPADRWPLEQWFDADPATPGKISTRWGGFLEDIRGFDASFFDISPREAERMDPQQRVALEVACEALERAGFALSDLRGSNTGVYFSSYHNDYTFLQYDDIESVTSRTLTGTLHSVIPNRISYALGLRGPSMTVDSACSSSLVGCHLASQALRNRDCDAAIVGGVNLMITPHVTVALSKGGFMSPTGHCWTFDANADGFIRGEGCAVVVLKRLSDAIAAGDPILAVIRGSAVNQDGTPTTLSAPNGLAQAELVRSALRSAGLTVNDISVVEAHGTGTELGDPIETDALGEVYAARDPALGPCWLGSLKSNFGHLEAAAGLAGLIKSILVLRHGVVPPHALFTRANPHLNLDERVLAIAREPTPLPDTTLRRAGVSAFGVGGTNAHVILEQAPPELAAKPQSSPAPYLLALSARSDQSMRRLASAYAELLRAGEDAGAVARAAARRRAHYLEHRAALVASDASALIDELTRIADGARNTRVSAHSPPVCFVFSGQGTQWSGMALGLREADRTFAAELQRIDEAFAAAGSIRPIEELERVGPTSRLERTDVAQVCLFAVQAALLNVLEQRGIRPSVVMGHSAGELAAAYAAGMLTLEAAVQAVLARSTAMQSAFDTGRMIAVRLTEADAQTFITQSGLPLTLSAVNGPSAVVLSGSAEAVSDARERLERSGTPHSVLDVRFPFHSELMEDAARQVRSGGFAGGGAGGDVTFISTVTGVEQTVFDSEYLARNVREPVRFSAAVERAVAMGVRHFIEVGPHPALGNAIVETAEATGCEVAVTYTQHRERDPVEALYLTIGRAYEWGVDPDWSAVYPGPCPYVDLPTYPWHHIPYWLPERKGARTGTSVRTRFPGTRVRSPALTRAVFEICADDRVLDAFHDHHVNGETRLPATALLELVRTAAVEAGNARPVVSNVGIVRPVELGAMRRVQVIVDQDGTGRADVFVEDAAGEWLSVVSADVETAGAEPPPAVPSSAEAAPVDPATVYAWLERAGLDFGPAFRLLRTAQATDQVAHGSIAIETAPEWQGDVNPAVVDAASHLCLAVLEAAGSPLANRALLPSTVDAYRVFGDATHATQAVVRLRDADSAGATFDVYLLDAAGEPLVSLAGWRLRPAAPAADVVRESGWEPTPPAARTASLGRWLILRDAVSGIAVEIAAQLRKLGHTVEELGLDSSDFETKLREPDVTGVVHLAALDDADPLCDGPAALEVARSMARPILSIAGSVDASRSLRLVVVTSGAQRTGRFSSRTAPVGAVVLGLVRALRVEAPHVECLAVDLASVDQEASSVAETLVADILGGDTGEVVHCDGVRLAHRSAPADMKRTQSLPGYVELVHERPGTLDGLLLRTASARDLPPGHIRVSVLAAGVNFRDVLVALGTYPGQAAMGMECCGLVAEVGEGVTGFAVGDRVLVFAPGCFANEVVAPADFVFHAPRNLTPAECATLPIAYGTAWYALFEQGRLQPGSRVLVHAGAGGVGQAAINLALQHGATVYATAGTEEKRARLLEMGVAGAFDSRSTQFAADVLAATNGEGVSLVINSLVGDMIAAGLSCLEPGGMFIELGKRELLTTDEVRALRHDVEYRAFDLRDAAVADPTLLPRIHRELREAIEHNRIAPLTVTTFPLREAESAFRRMSRGQHVGKLVLIPPPAPTTHHGWTVVTGGTGGMGESTLRWVLESGARAVAVWSRSGSSPELEQRLDSLRREFDARIVANAVDVADPEAVHTALGVLRDAGLPITGVVHAAGVLDDGTLQNVTAERLQAVLSPKLAGAWNLHVATLEDPIRMFVLFSAVGSLIDGAGQGSYSAGNAFLDALACRRRAMGMPATAIRWGLFAGGMATAMDAAQQERWIRKGLDWLDTQSGGRAFAAAISTDAPHVIAVRLSTSGRERTKTNADRGDGLGLQLAGLQADEARTMLLTHVQSVVTTMLGLSSPADLEAPLRDIGLDSLSAIELRNALTVSSGVSLPATLAFDYPTVTAIAGFLLDRLGFVSHDAHAAPDVAPVDDIDALSDDEAEAELMAELELLRAETP